MEEQQKMEERKTEEHKHETHQQEPAVHHKKESKFMKWLKGSNGKDYVENFSYVIIVLSTILISIGLLGGSFVTGVVYSAIIGVAFLLVGIVIFISSQFMEVK